MRSASENPAGARADEPRAVRLERERLEVLERMRQNADDQAVDDERAAIAHEGEDGAKPERSPSHRGRSRNASRNRPSRTSVAGDVGFVRGDEVELAARLLEVVRGEGEPPVYARGALHRYAPSDGIWERVSADEESRIVQAFAGAPLGDNRVLQVRAASVEGARKLAHAQAASPKFFDDGPPGLAFANGFVTVDSSGVKLAAHRPQHRATAKMAYPYRAGARPIRLLAFFDQVFAGDADAEGKVRFLREFVGACLVGVATRYQRAVVLWGEGANGKSVLIEIACAAFTGALLAAIPPQKWEDDYHRAMLDGVRLNAVSELPEQDILASESFKAVIAGDAVTGRHIREAPITFKPIAGHLFAANHLPGTADLSDGFWRRLVVVTFNRTFAVHEQRSGLAADIVAAELADVVAWAVEGAAELLARGAFDLPKSSVDAVAEWKSTADNVGTFLHECTTKVPAHALGRREHWTLSAALYGAYQRWAMTNGFRPVSSKKFKARAKAVGVGGEHTERGTAYPVTLNSGVGA